VENQFSGVDFLMVGPFDVFPRVFNAAGFVYICPQQLSLHLMQHDGITASEYPRAIAQYITEGRHVGDRIVIKIFRDDAPVAGSEVFVGFPEQKLGG
jgi:isocitrate dehydrogenase kinase/phosphatase